MHPLNRVRNSVLCALSLLLTHPFASATIYQFRVSAPKVVAAVAPPPAAPRVYAQWDAAKSGAGFTITDLVLTSRAYSSTSGITRATVGMSSGKWYWEVTRSGNANKEAIGISGSLNTNSAPYGDDPQNLNYRIAYGQNNGLGAAAANVQRIAIPNASGDTLGFALDMTTGTFSIYENCSATPYGIWSGVTGTVYPIVSQGGGSGGAVLTANFGATALLCAPPAGYNAGVW